MTLAVYDVKGGLVKTLVDNEHRTGGEHRINYDASGATGVYFVRLETGRGMKTLKIVVLK